jgi:hypothetical protein
VYRSTRALTGVALAAALTVAGCSSATTTAPITAASTSDAAPSSSAAGNVGLSGNGILVNFRQAITQGTAVHVNGVLTSAGQTVTLDLYLNKGADASGSIGSSGATIPFRSIGGVDYFQFTDSVLKLTGASSNPQAAAVLRDKWVSSKSRVGSGLESAFSNFTSYDAFLGSLSRSPIGGSNTGISFTVATGTNTFKGRQVAMYTDSEDAAAYFPLTGLAYLIAIQTSASGPTGINTLTFTWNQPAKVAALPNADIYTG